LESPLVSTKSPVRITCVSQGDAVTEESNGAILEQFNVSASVWESPIHTSAEPPVWSTPRLVSTTVAVHTDDNYSYRRYGRRHAPPNRQHICSHIFITRTKIETE
jgi:hypothetical protein